MLKVFICEQCKKKFERIGSHKYRFCSRKCKGDYKHDNNPNFKIVKCSYCNKLIGRRKVKKNNVYLCNSSCQLNYEYKNNLRDLKGIHQTHINLREKAKIKLKKGHKHFNRNLGHDGYWQIYVPLSGWRREHLYLWEQKYGKIPNGYELHHIDGDKTNNNLKNITLLTKYQHRKLHNQPRDKNNGRFTTKD
jgi:ribosomal protein L24E